jgi:hypothetical protein
MDTNINSNKNYKCVNYKFCKGVAYPELDEPLCLLCGEWYDYGEGWGTLEFTEEPRECSVCYTVDIQMKFPTNCNHYFCIYCSRTLLYYQDDIYDICPLKYGCPPCKHYDKKNSVKSCINRPCCDDDEDILLKWEEDDYESFMDWNYEEFNYINEENDFFVTKKCPLCRKQYEKLK